MKDKNEDQVSYESFAIWVNQYQGDQRGLGYPVVEAAYNAGVEYAEQKSLKLDKREKYLLESCLSIVRKQFGFEDYSDLFPILEEKIRNL